MMPKRDSAGQEDASHELFNEKYVLYPFPDDLFWQASDEGTWDGEGVPSWMNPLAGSMAVG